MRNKRCCDCHYCTNRGFASADHGCRKLGIHIDRDDFVERHGCVCFKEPEPKIEEPLPATDGSDYEYLFKKEQDNGTAPRL